jgi:hypothetical protein
MDLQNMEEYQDKCTDKETLRFLYDKRLELFNIRRDHEWKVFFGAMTLIGAVDAAIITQKVILSPSQYKGWGIILILITTSCIIYEFGVQRRNRVDRIAIHEINTRLCNLICLPYTSSIRHPVDHHTEKIVSHKNKALKELGIFRIYYLWAFIWQAIILISVCVISFFIPFVSTADAPKG